MQHWTITKRIVAGFTIIVALGAVMGLLAWSFLLVIGEHADELAGDNVPALSESADVLQNISIAHQALTRAVLAANADEQQACAAKLKAIGEENTKLLGELEKHCNDPEEKQLFGKVTQARQDYLNARAPILQLLGAGKKDEALAQLLTTGSAAFNVLDGTAMELNDLETKLGTDAANTIQHNAKSAKIMIGLVLLGELVISLFLATVIIRGLNRMLKTVSASLADGSSQVSAASGQVSAASQTLAEGASEQASSLEETSSSLEEMASMAKRNAENLQQANDLARQARAAADRGVTDMEAMNGAMAAIKVSSDDIAKIIKTIDEIAFQTNILALNAAVEAARAGEAGMGFAVVADEVRNLAQRSAQAAKETAVKIEGAISRTAQGVQLSQKVTETLNVIVTKARQVDELATEVAGASREQTQGITQINAAVGQMDKVTQSNAASAEESAAAAEELNAQAQLMQESVNELMQLVGGSRETSGRVSTVQAARRSESASAPRQAFSSRAAITRTVPAHDDNDKSFATSADVMPVALEPDRQPVGIIGWHQERMSTGVQTVDEQHQELISRINDLHAACLVGKAREELMEQLDFLGKYATAHFAHEEGIMDKHACPSRGQNKAAHVKFLHDYQRLVEMVEETGATTKVAIELKRMLADWLGSHICTIDTKLRDCHPPEPFETSITKAQAKRNEIPMPETSLKF